MSTSQRAFQQVRSILEKLDRRIDEAREARLHPHPAPAEAQPAPTARPGAQDAAPIPAPSAQPTHGRARPIPKDDRR